MLKKIDIDKSAIITKKKKDVMSIYQLNYKALEKSQATEKTVGFNRLTPNDPYMGPYRIANLQTLHFIYLFNKYRY